MVETLDDKWKKTGQTLQGNVLAYWSKLSASKQLVDASSNFGFTWSSNQKDANFKAARLDRVYCSNEVTLDHPAFECFLDKGCLLSNHSPFCFKASPPLITLN